MFSYLLPASARRQSESSKWTIDLRLSKFEGARQAERQMNALKVIEIG